MYSCRGIEGVDINSKYQIRHQYEDRPSCCTALCLRALRCAHLKQRTHRCACAFSLAMCAVVDVQPLTDCGTPVLPAYSKFSLETLIPCAACLNYDLHGVEKHTMRVHVYAAVREGHQLAVPLVCS
eukprot:IDg17960t1